MMTDDERQMSDDGTRMMMDDDGTMTDDDDDVDEEMNCPTVPRTNEIIKQAQAKRASANGRKLTGAMATGGERRVVERCGVTGDGGSAVAGDGDGQMRSGVGTAMRRAGSGMPGSDGMVNWNDGPGCVSGNAGEAGME